MMKITDDELMELLFETRRVFQKKGLETREETKIVMEGILNMGIPQQQLYRVLKDWNENKR